MNDPQTTTAAAAAVAAAAKVDEKEKETPAKTCLKEGCKYYGSEEFDHYCSNGMPGRIIPLGDMIGTGVFVDPMRPLISDEDFSRLRRLLNKAKSKMRYGEVLAGLLDELDYVKAPTN